MRKAYGKALIELGKQNKNIVVLDADLSHSTHTSMFGDKWPERFFNCGVAEQNMVGTAAGLALAGKIPFASTFAMFMPGRCYNQIRNSVCYSNLNVKFVSTHSGISVGKDGSSHQPLEDISLMRGLPNMRVWVPADSVEVNRMVKKAAEVTGPVYVRVSRLNVDDFYNSSYKFSEKAIIMREGDDLTIVACGLMVKPAIEAAEALKKKKISAGVINMHSIKPLDEKAVVSAAKKTGAILTAEEHSVNGGLGSAVAEACGEKYPVPFHRIGVQDRFGQSGSPEALFREYGLTSGNIIKSSLTLLKRR